MLLFCIVPSLITVVQLYCFIIALFMYVAVLPTRETPLMFAHPHVVAHFSGAGKLISVVPSLYSRSVEISSVKVSGPIAVLV